MLKFYRDWQRGRTYPSFTEALKRCGDGYNDADLARVTVERSKKFRSSLERNRIELDLGHMRPLIPLALGDVQTVLDFGGGCGSQYWIAKRLTGRAYRWNVSETEALVEASKPLENQDLRFFSEIEDAARDLGAVDLVYASGSLPYTPDPYGFLRRLVAVDARSLFITRNALADNEAVIIQRLRLSTYDPTPLPDGMKDRETARPVTICRMDKFEAIMSEKYNIKLRLHEDHSGHYVGRKKVAFWGYYCERK